MSFNYFNPYGQQTVGQYQQYGGYRPRRPHYRRNFQPVRFQGPFNRPETFTYEGLWKYNNQTGERKLDIGKGLLLSAGVIFGAKLLLGDGKKGATGDVGKVKTGGGDFYYGNGEGSRNSKTKES